MLSLRKGGKVSYEGVTYEILKQKDFDTVIGINTETKETTELPIAGLSMPVDVPAHAKLPLEAQNDKHREEANGKLKIIEPLLQSGRTRKQVGERAAEYGVSISTIYNWINRYEQTYSLSSLVPAYLLKGGKGKSRLKEKTESIIRQVIEGRYLTKQKLAVTAVYDEIRMLCRESGETFPSINTVRNRIREIAPSDVIKGRRGRSEFLSGYSAVKDSFDAKFPLEIVQIDHTPLDIMVVDDAMRKPIGRPYLTVATDIFSRMIYGFYLTLQAPSYFSVGQTVYLGIMPKKTYLQSMGIEGTWNIFGLPKSMTIHMDNAAEFRGYALKRFCEEYNIGVDFRPRGAPYYGGHIERLVKTINMKIHTLPGTTFSNPKEKGDYDSEGKAVFTMKELERWIAEFIVNSYHKTIHSSLGTTPEKKYETGVFGDADTPGTGLPDIMDREEAERIRISLLPFEERTVQKDGISFEGIKYFHDLLRKYIRIEGKGGVRKSFTIRYDPRDLSKIYFYEPDLKMYFPIPYRNMGFPSISLWNVREAKKRLRNAGLRDFDETAIFQSFKKLRQIEAESYEKTKSARRKLSSDNHHREKINFEIKNRLSLTPAYKKTDENPETPAAGSGNAAKTEQESSGTTRNMEYKKEIKAFEIDEYDD
ncbi:MAG: transposase [bacterium]